MSKLSHDQCRGTHGPGYFEAFQLDLQRGNNVEPVIPPAPKSQIGTNLRAIIARELPGVMTCETCAEMIVKLNNMTRDEVLEDIDNIVSEQASWAEKQAPKLWQRLAVKIDQVFNIGETERRIKRWILEAAGGTS